MTTFSQPDYNSSAYSAYRPIYGPKLYEKIYSFHKSHNGKFDNALDIATGTGQVASELSNSFNQVYAIDASSTMLKNAIKKPNIIYSVSSAEDLSQISSNSIDLVTAAQSVHWFNLSEFYKESFRVLKPQGTLAIWVYNQNILKDYPIFRQSIEKLIKADDKLGPYWDKRAQYIEDLYKDLRFPEEMFQNVEREIYNGDETPDTEPLFITEWTIPRLANYFKTWSSYKNYLKANPNSTDPIDEYLADLKQLTGLDDNEVLRVHWQSAFILAERKS